MTQPAPCPVAFLDIESDGLRPRRRPWEIAIIRREPDGRQTEWQAFVEINLKSGEPKGLRVGGFYDRHPLGRHLSRLSRPGDSDNDGTDPPEVGTGVGGYLTKSDAARTVACLTHDALIVGAVPSFDTDVLARLLRKHSLIEAWQHRVRCVQTLTAGHFGREVGGLGDCAQALGVEHPDAHTALGDARTAMGIWDAVIGGGDRAR